MGKQTFKSIKRLKLDDSDQLAVGLLALVIGYVEGKYGKPDRLAPDDMGNNAYYMFRRLVDNARKPTSIAADIAAKRKVR